MSNKLFNINKKNKKKYNIDFHRKNILNTLNILYEIKNKNPILLSG